ncbi:MAG TPA: signal peptide peptidase SppA, partial [Bacteroidaceae bacterium]|nr:signal peptide peptidase SppA [Bacteroidaceae bacterium]
MKSFFKFTLATILGIFISSLLFLLILLIIVSGATKKEIPKVAENTILVAKFSGPVTDRASDNPFSSLMAGNIPGEGVMGLDQILKDIRKAKTDKNIAGIFLRLGNVPAGMATVEEIRDALLDFKESGKFIYAHADFYTQKAYY